MRRGSNAVCAAQFAFDEQWQALRDYAHARGVRLFGDLPIYVAPDSVETWAASRAVPARRRRARDPGGGRAARLLRRRRPALGQSALRLGADGARWLRPLAAPHAAPVRALRPAAPRPLPRPRVALGRARRRRHDRAKASGCRRRARRCCEAIAEEAPDLPVVAEDLGEITPEVEALRRRFALPGMHVLQFAFDGDPMLTHLPHCHAPDGVVYTGTHDNDTLRGWYAALDEPPRARVEFYPARAPGEVPTALLRAALALGGAARGTADAGPARPRQRGALQHAGHDERQLELAAAGCRCWARNERARRFRNAQVVSLRGAPADRTT